MKPTNEYLVTGRLTHDPEYKTLPSGTSVYEVKIAKSFKPYGKDEYQSFYIKAKLWKDKADEANELNLHKGDSVMLFGGLQTEEYNGKQYLVMPFAEMKDYEKAVVNNAPSGDEDVPF